MLSHQLIKPTAVNFAWTVEKNRKLLPGVGIQQSWLVHPYQGIKQSADKGYGFYRPNMPNAYPVLVRNHVRPIFDNNSGIS